MGGELKLDRADCDTLSCRAGLNAGQCSCLVMR